MLPDKPLHIRGSASQGTNLSKEKITLVFACSAMGEKLKPLVIGKFANPRCFKNFTMKDVLCNKKASMSEISRLGLKV